MYGCVDVSCISENACRSVCVCLCVCTHLCVHIHRQTEVSVKVCLSMMMEREGSLSFNIVLPGH